MRSARRAVTHLLTKGEWDKAEAVYGSHTHRDYSRGYWFGTLWRHHSGTAAPHPLPRVVVRTRSGGIKSMVCNHAVKDAYLTAQGPHLYGTRKKTKAPLKVKSPSLLDIEAGAKRDRARKNKTRAEAKARREAEAAHLQRIERGTHLLRREHRHSYLTNPPYNAPYLSVKPEKCGRWWNLSDHEIASSIQDGSFAELHARMTEENEDGEQVDAYFAYKLWSRLWRFWGSWLCLQGHNNAGDRTITCHKCGGL